MASSIRTAMFLIACLSPISPTVAQDYSFQGAIDRLKGLLNQLPLDVRASVESGIKRLEEGEKMKDQNGKQNPRIIDGSAFFSRNPKPAAKGYTSPDDAKTEKSHKGWGADEKIYINIALLDYIRGKLDNVCPLSKAADKDAWKETFEAVILHHESIHVDQAAASAAEVACQECMAWGMSFSLMTEITWSDPCLRAQWERRTAAALSAENYYCNKCGQ